jgi:DHA1 family solute carrier family 18 vesicular amine transporter 1/2
MIVIASWLASVRANWTVTVVVAFALFMDNFIYGLVIPLTPYSPVKLGSEGHIGILFGGYAIGVLGATFLFGYLGDRVGFRRTFIYGVALSGAAVCSLCLAPNFLFLFVARLFLGAASAGTWVSGLALVAAHYSSRRVEMMGFVFMGSTAGSVVGPFIGGALYEWGGYALPFLLTVVLVAVDAGFRIRLIPPDRTRPEPCPDLPGLLRDRSVLVPALAVALAAFGWSTVEPLLPAHLARMGVMPWAIGLMFTISAVVCGIAAPVVGWVSGRVAIRKVIACGALGMAITLPLLDLFPGIALTAIGLCLVNVAFAFTMNPTAAEMANAVDRRGMSCYSTVSAVSSVAYSIGMMASTTLTFVTALRLNFFEILVCVSLGLSLCVPLLLRKGSSLPVVSAAHAVPPR